MVYFVVSTTSKKILCSFSFSFSELQMTIDELKKRCMVIHSSCIFDVQALSPELAVEVES
jgi:hypothetical protein